MGFHIQTLAFVSLRHRMNFEPVNEILLIVGFWKKKIEKFKDK